MRRRLAALSAMVMLFAACGGDDSDGSAKTAESGPADGSGEDGRPTDGASDDVPDEPSLDSCALLTADEVESTLGVATPGVPEDYPPSFYGCRWETDDLDNVSLSVLIYPDADAAAESFADTVELNGYALVDDLGDRAYDTSPIRGLTAQKGRYEVSLSVFLSDDDDQAMLDLLGAALGRVDQ